MSTYLALAAADTITGFVPGTGKDIVDHGNNALKSDDGTVSTVAFLSAAAASGFDFTAAANKTSTMFNFTTQIVGDFTTAAGVLAGVNALVGNASTASNLNAFVVLHDNQTTSNGLLLHITEGGGAGIILSEIQVVGVISGMGSTAMVAGNFA